MDAAAGDRQALVDHLVANPPVVHMVDTPEGKVPGVWCTEESCYRLIAEVTEPDSTTLETGCGLSTALFAALGARHRCVTATAGEAEQMRRYFDEHGIPGDLVTFDIASSHEALPILHTQLDVVLIDGGHGFPVPILDWFYAGSLLRRGGTMFIDDLQLRAVRSLLEFLDADPRWQPLGRTDKWAAFRRLSSGSLAEGQWDQPFYADELVDKRPLVRKIAGRARREIRNRLRP